MSSQPPDPPGPADPREPRAPEDPQVPRRTREDVLRDFRTDQILEAARQVIGEVGYEAASIERIAEVAGVGRSTIYVYVNGKEDLLNRLLARHRVELNQRVQAAVSGAEHFEDRLRAFLTAVLEYVSDYPAFFQSIVRTRGLDPFFLEEDRPAPELEVIRAEALGVFSSILKDAETRAEFSRGAAPEVVEMFGMVVYGALMHRVHEPSPPPAEDQARRITRVLLYGLSADANAGAKSAGAAADKASTDTPSPGRAPDKDQP